MPAERGPTVVLASPYLRAAADGGADRSKRRASTATTSLFAVDERLREKEFGILDRLTTVGIEQQYPEQAELRARVGKFYYRPPGGESWCDVILRLRSVIDTLTREYRRERVLVVAPPGDRALLPLPARAHDRSSRSSRSTASPTWPTAPSPRTRTNPTAALGNTASWCCARFNFVAPLEEAARRHPRAGRAGGTKERLACPTAHGA